MPGLRDFNKALLSKWPWKLLAVSNNQWTCIATRRYFKRARRNALLGKQGGKILALWKGVRKNAETFKERLSFKVMAGKDGFLGGQMVGVGKLRDAFLTLYSSATNKGCAVASQFSGRT